MMRWAGHVADVGEERNACRILVEKPERNRPLDKPRRGWEIVLKYYISDNYDRVWSGFIWLMIWTSGAIL
jgi:hypothetical protein